MTSPRTVDDLAFELLGKTSDALSVSERRVLLRIHKRETISKDMGLVHDAESTFGQRLSDHVAAVGGSWAFIISFGVVLFGWMLLNSKFVTGSEAFDPYPFIFLNLMLSTLAAIQAPIIMMSQNRQADKDRAAASHDYEVNLRAELEILRLHEKVNALMSAVEGIADGQKRDQAQ